METYGDDILFIPLETMLIQWRGSHRHVDKRSILCSAPTLNDASSHLLFPLGLSDPALKFTLRENMHRPRTLNREGLEHVVRSCGLLGTIAIQKDAGRTPTNDFRQRSIEAAEMGTRAV